MSFLRTNSEHVCGSVGVFNFNLASSTGPDVQFQLSSGELFRAQMSNFNLRLASSLRAQIFDVFNLHLASSLRAQISKSNFRLASSFQGPDVRCVSTFVWRAPPGPRLIDLRRTRKRKSADGGRAEVDYFLLGVQRPSATPALVATPKESKVSLVVVE